MKTQKEINDRISSHREKKKSIQELYIKAIDKEQQDFYAAEIVRYDFMIMQLQWVLES